MAKPEKEKVPVNPNLIPDDCVEIIAKAVTNFKGQGPEVESAAGMLIMGHVFGWKVLYVWHSVATMKKYEKILGIDAKERFPEYTEHSHRSPGFQIASKLSNFWRVIRGVDHVEGARDKGIE